MKLTRAEKHQVKKVARELLETPKTGKVVLDWRKRHQRRARVFLTIEDVFNKGPPEKYTPEVFEEKCRLVYEHIYDSYFGEEKGVYTGLV